MNLELRSETELFLLDFNQGFHGILAENAGYFIPNYGQVRNEIDFGGYKNRYYKSLHVEDLKNGYKVTLSTSQGNKIFVIYPDNSIEFYNGYGDWNTTDYPDTPRIQWD